MMNNLRGRNLAHPGCLIGVTTGLTLGIVLAGVLAIYRVDLNTDLLIWLGLTIGLGLTGWIIGDRLSSRFPALDERPEALQKSSGVSDEESPQPSDEISISSNVENISEDRKATKSQSRD